MISELLSGVFAGPCSALDKSASIRFLSTYLANAVDLESMPGGNVVVFVSDFLFDFSDFLREKFDRSAALGADHVMMTAAVVLVFVACDAVVKGNFAGQAATCQQLQRPVDGGETDARVSFLDQSMQLVDRKMLTSFQEGAQNCVALSSLFQADAFEMLQENSFSFADVLLRDGRLIVDSILQHVGWSGHSR